MIKKAGTILINKDTKCIGLVKRNKHGDISFPKGHLEDNETLHECAIRETIEETGRNCKIIIKDPIGIMNYTNKEGNVEVYLFLAEDLGEITNKIDEELIWVKANEVANILTHNELKELYLNIYDTILEYL